MTVRCNTYNSGKGSFSGGNKASGGGGKGGGPNRGRSGKEVAAVSKTTATHTQLKYYTRELIDNASV